MKLERNVVQHLFVIDEPLRAFFAALAASLKIELSQIELHRVFEDSENDQVSKKEYCFIQTRGLTVVGVVEEYEPETIWIRLFGRSKAESAFTALVERFFI